MCDSGYYKLYGICKKCDGTALVTFLALVVPVVAVLGGTLFVFWACTPRATVAFEPAPSHSLSVAATGEKRLLIVIPLGDMVSFSSLSFEHPIWLHRSLCFRRLTVAFTNIFASHWLTGSRTVIKGTVRIAELVVYLISEDTNAWDLGRCRDPLPRDDSACNNRGPTFKPQLGTDLCCFLELA